MAVVRPTVEERGERKRAADHHALCLESGIQGVDEAEVDLPLVVAARAGHRRGRAVEDERTLAGVSEREGDAGALKSRAEHEDVGVGRECHPRTLRRLR